jgi:DNA-binding response OmpR family regulator
MAFRFSKESCGILDLVQDAMRILIVEDDQKLARQLRKGLEEEHHSVHLEATGPAGLAAAERGSFDILVFDVMLPGMDGFALVRNVRTHNTTAPILLLTARDAPEDVVAGLDAGADDYLTKPFSFRVLMARLRALVRRGAQGVKINDLRLDETAHTVTRGGVPVSLTRTEFILLDYLLKNAGRVISRDRLIEAAWGHEREVENNTLDVFICQLRAKIDPPGARKLLHTVRGIGYTLREEEPA